MRTDAAPSPAPAAPGRQVTRVLLVTGSRVLADSPAAERWARAILRAAVNALPSDGMLVVGDAPGPDRWALWAAHDAELSPEWRIYRLDGSVRASNAHDWAWTTPFDVACRGDRKRWPLVRNDAMVRETVVLSREGWEVSAVALLAPWATTHGSEHTARLVEGARLPVVRHVCPLELRGKK